MRKKLLCYASLLALLLSENGVTHVNAVDYDSVISMDTLDKAIQLVPAGNGFASAGWTGTAMDDVVMFKFTLNKPSFVDFGVYLDYFSESNIGFSKWYIGMKDDFTGSFRSLALCDDDSLPMNDGYKNFSYLLDKGTYCVALDNFYTKGGGKLDVTGLAKSQNLCYIDMNVNEVTGGVYSFNSAKVITADKDDFGTPVDVILANGGMQSAITDQYLKLSVPYDKTKYEFYIGAELPVTYSDSSDGNFSFVLEDENGAPQAELKPSDSRCSVTVAEKGTYYLHIHANTIFGTSKQYNGRLNISVAQRNNLDGAESSEDVTQAKPISDGSSSGNSSSGKKDTTSNPSSNTSSSSGNSTDSTVLKNPNDNVTKTPTKRPNGTIHFTVKGTKWGSKKITVKTYTKGCKLVLWAAGKKYVKTSKTKTITVKLKTKLDNGDMVKGQVSKKGWVSASFSKKIFKNLRAK